MESKRLRIDNPCPFLLKRMNKNEDGYYCRACSKTIVDFREETEVEIISGIDKDTCGIFYRHQLKGQQKMPKFRQLAFYFLTFLSFIGFSVKPLYGQSETTAVKQNTTESKPKKVKDKKSKKSHSKRGKSKKQQFKVIGTPSF